MPRNWIYAGIIGLVVLGTYLAQLWTPERQVELHSLNLLEAVEESDWADVADFLAESYADDWGHDKAVLLSRLRQTLRYARGGQLGVRDASVRATSEEGEWRARISIEGETNELTAPLVGQFNAVAEPFVLQWRRQSWKPWDWKLVRVSNPGFEIPRGLGL